jgi:hypothetical protein
VLHRPIETTRLIGMWLWGVARRISSYREFHFSGVRRRRTIWFTGKCRGCISMPTRADKTENPVSTLTLIYFARRVRDRKQRK